MKKSTEGPYGAVVKIDAMKQVVMLKCLRIREGALRKKEREIQQFQALIEQTEVYRLALISDVATSQMKLLLALEKEIYLMYPHILRS